MQYLYLHGFASNPQSRKAQFFADQFAQRGISLTIPDLNQGNFAGLTLTRQLTFLQDHYLQSAASYTVIGSSLGGLTAAWLAQQCPQVERLVLLAPAFGFIGNWLQRLPPAQLQAWQETGFLSVYHYGDRREQPLAYEFVTDALTYDEQALQRPVPTLILHGLRDEVVPVAVSEQYGKARPWVTYCPVDSDHALTDVLPDLWEATAAFLPLPQPNC